MTRDVSKAFSNAFDVRLVEQTSARWEFWYGLLEEFVAEFGTGWMERSEIYRGHKLGQWVGIQRSRWDELSEERQNRLLEIPGWVANVNDALWENGFSHLVEYVEERGNALVKQPYRSNDKFKLGSWVTSQRVSYRVGELDADRKARLEGVHPTWSWDSRADWWEEGFRYLCEYIEREGDALVPDEYKTPDNFALGKWVGKQRSRRATMEPPSRIARLEAAHPTWSWNAHSARWAEGINELRGYIEREGNARVPDGHVTPNGFKLGTWVVNRRQDYRRTKPDSAQPTRRTKLNPAQIAELEAVHPTWAWSSREAWWEEAFERLLAYVAKNGTAWVRADYECRDKYALGAWASRQRSLYHCGKLDESQQARLDQLPGWEWSTGMGRIPGMPLRG